MDALSQCWTYEVTCQVQPHRPIKVVGTWNVLFTFSRMKEKTQRVIIETKKAALSNYLITSKSFGEFPKIIK